MNQRRTNLTAVELVEPSESLPGRRKKLSAEGLALLARLDEEVAASRAGNSEVPANGNGDKPPTGAGPKSNNDAPPPAANPEVPKETPKPTPGGHEHGENGGGCCEAITVRLESIKIEELTLPRQFKDNVVVTGLSQGEVMNPSPMQFAWPLDRDGDIDAQDMDKGDEARPTNLVARARVGRDCAVSLECEIRYWEEDASELAELLKEAAQMLSAALAAQQGVSMPAATSGLIRKIMKEIAKKLGLTDDDMGAYSFKVSGRMTCATQIDQLTWEPPWGEGGYAHEKVNARTARLSRTFGAHGGRWKTSILVQMVCPNCP